MICDGFDAPIGTDEQRHSDQVWPAGWLDASPFGQLYLKGTPRQAYHTGADLNANALPDGTRKWDYDAHQPVYACADGVVTFAAALRVWGNVIVIRHELADGETVYSRYAHVEALDVVAGQQVRRGQALARVGNANGTQAYHLHFDIGITDALLHKPGHWPGMNRADIFKHYADPRLFILAHRPQSADDVPLSFKQYVVDLMAGD